MEVYLIRHTTPKIDKGICYGQTDLDINENFKQESEKVIQELANLKDDTTIFSSPLQRCLKLVNKISKNQPIIDERLMEMNFGDWELQAWDAIDQTELNLWMDDFVNISCPNGESYQILFERTTHFIKELKEKNFSKAIVVTHGGVIRAILSYIKQEPLSKSFETEVNYGAIFKVNI